MLYQNMLSFSSVVDLIWFPLDEETLKNETYKPEVLDSYPQKIDKQKQHSYLENGEMVRFIPNSKTLYILLSFPQNSLVYH